MLIFAHRGASADAPENTLLAIQEALNQDADGIEIDVHQLEDSLVVIHDRWVGRTTNGIGLLEDYSLQGLQQLDAGLGQPVPFLWQVLQLVAGRCQINIEMKGVTLPSLVAQCILQAQQQLGFSAEQFIVSSFNHPLLVSFKALAPQIKIGALTGCIPIDYAQFAQQMGAYSVNADLCFIDQAFVQDAKSRGLKVYVYTVDDQRDLLRMKSWGVDGVFSNHPAKAKYLLGSGDN
jgi:glycerophosphoryl diester phosphodiesterase